jgi:hypothetical protein
VYAGLGFLVIPVFVALGWGAWGALTWATYGHPAPSHNGDSVMTAVMPRYEVDENHERLIAAPPSVVRSAVDRFTLYDSPVIRGIFRARELILRAAKDTAPIQPFVIQARAIGWAQLAAGPGQEIVFGAVTQPWAGEVHFRPLPRDQFIAFDSAGYVKIVWSIAADSLGPDLTRLRTETRAETTDPGARARFRRYWAVFSPGIILIRREALRVIANRAQS